MIETLNNQGAFVINTAAELTGGIEFQIAKRENKKIGKGPDYKFADRNIITYEFLDVTICKIDEFERREITWRSMFTKDFPNWKENGLTFPLPSNLVVNQNTGFLKKNTHLDFEDPSMQDLLNKTIFALDQLDVAFPEAKIKYTNMENVMNTLFQDRDAELNPFFVRKLMKGDAILTSEDNEGRIMLTIGNIDNPKNKIVLRKSALQITYVPVLSKGQRLELHINNILTARRKPQLLIEDVDEKKIRVFKLNNGELARLRAAATGMTTSNSSF
jgi:hypothetical protein